MTLTPAVTAVQEATARVEHTEEETIRKTVVTQTDHSGHPKSKGQRLETLVEREKSRRFLFFRWRTAFRFKSTIR